MPHLAAQRAAFINRLASRTPLSEGERGVLADLVRQLEGTAARVDLVRQDECPPHMSVLIEGYAACYKLKAGGERQIVQFHLPGEVLDFHVSMLGLADHSIMTLSRCRVARVPRATLLRVMDAYPAIARAFWQETLVDAAILREWMVNIGRRETYARVAHLFCELKMRMHAIGRCNGTSFEFPATQGELGDAMGVTAVHMNRTMQALRAARLLDMHGHCINIQDWDRLCEVAEFDPTYLHLGQSSPDAARRCDRDPSA